MLFGFGVFSVKGAFPAWLALPYYLLIVVMAKFFGFDKKPRRIISAVLAFVICLSFTIVGINGARETEIAVTSSLGLSAVSISRGNESVVLVTHADEYFNSGNLRRYLNKRNIKNVVNSSLPILQ